MNDKESDHSITVSKFCANGKKYFSIFDKYIPRGLTGNIMLFGISNPDTANLICAKNPAARYVIVDDKTLCSPNKGRCLLYREIINQDYSISILNNANLNEFPNIDMKFDCIIMNPPYKRNIHLKVLAEAIKHLKDDNSKVVNLSPSRWLEDPLASYKKNNDYHRFEDKVGKHIEDAEIISADVARSLFNASFGTNLGLYICGKNAVYENYTNISKNSILTKVIPYLVSHNPVFETNKQDGWRVRIPTIIGGNGRIGIKILDLGNLFAFKDGKYKDGKWWYECYSFNQYSKTTPYITNSILFENEEKANNFVKQYDTHFAKYLTDKLLSDIHVTEEKVLWMEDAVNPRTGKKGYESDWTDEDFCKFFNITDEEYEEIVKQATRYDKKK